MGIKSVFRRHQCSVEGILATVFCAKQFVLTPEREPSHIIALVTDGDKRASNHPNDALTGTQKRI